jgi:aspartate-semialdehyde dehydrogenase
MARAFLFLFKHIHLLTQLMNFAIQIHRDESQPNTLNMWIVADNLRKGAATNAIQIGEYLIENNLV